MDRQEHGLTKPVVSYGEKWKVMLRVHYRTHSGSGCDELLHVIDTFSTKEAALEFGRDLTYRSSDLFEMAHVHVVGDSYSKPLDRGELFPEGWDKDRR